MGQDTGGAKAPEQATPAATAGDAATGGVQSGLTPTYTNPNFGQQVTAQGPNGAITGDSASFGNIGGGGNVLTSSSGQQINQLDPYAANAAGLPTGSGIGDFQTPGQAGTANYQNVDYSLNGSTATPTGVTTENPGSTFTNFVRPGAEYIGPLVAGAGAADSFGSVGALNDASAAAPAVDSSGTNLFAGQAPGDSGVVDSSGTNLFAGTAPADAAVPSATDAPYMGFSAAGAGAGTGTPISAQVGQMAAGLDTTPAVSDMPVVDSSGTNLFDQFANGQGGTVPPNTGSPGGFTPTGNDSLDTALNALKAGGNGLKAASPYIGPAATIASLVQQKRGAESAQNQFNAAAAPTQQAEAALLNQFKNGTLTADQSLQVANWTANQKAATNAYYAQAGLSDSSMHTQALAQIDAQAQAMTQQMINTALQQGLQTAGVTNPLLTAGINAGVKQDAATQQAMMNFLNTLAKMNTPNASAPSSAPAPSGAPT